ncbi:MAG TPA: MgtC/SapB family protein [Steroidobacter sp.]|jgi:putative Mg2+ transporter-C (MgtC) family protein|nr:MgtC/SapB family protein [Steroidobacter sp.]
MTHDYWEILGRLLAALLIGALIGMERSYSGRPAGFRTHALVCVSTALLMLVTAYQNEWFSPPDFRQVTLDPTRMAQGIMTGIGFLGAGVIVKAGYAVHGLTTAASIWMTAAIGVLVGIGFYIPAVFASTITLGVLSVFRWIEARTPALFYAELVVRFARESPMSEGELRRLILEHGFSIVNVQYRLNSKPSYFECRMAIRSSKHDQVRALIDAIAAAPSVQAFKLSPTGE